MICHGWQDSEEDGYGDFKSVRKSVIDSIVVYCFNHRCRSETTSTYGGNRKKDIGIWNCSFVYRNSALLSRLDTGSFLACMGGVLKFIVFAGEFIDAVMGLI